jgi:alkylhydroperoxidase family enzyme
VAWIRTISTGEADGPLRASYDRAVARAGRVFHIVSSMSMSPRMLDASMGLYLEVMHGSGGISRRRREMLAVVVSATNACHY